jgi:hypothetical protein
MSSRRTRSVLAAASALSVLALAACSGGGASGSDGGAQSGGGGKIKVVASTDVWGSVVNAVGGRPAAGAGGQSEHGQGRSGGEHAPGAARTHRGTPERDADANGNRCQIHLTPSG